jgi:hypothetical protein
VNCTECHYVSVEHLKKPFLSKPGPPTEAACLRCHDQKNSPSYEFAAFTERILHPMIEVIDAEPSIIVSSELPKPEVTAEPEDEPVAEEVVEKEKVAEELPVLQLKHVVVEGESLWKLAEQYLNDGTRWQEIYMLNRENISNPDLIREGQELNIQFPQGEE